MADPTASATATAAPGIADLVALLTGAISLPFLLGFFHWTGFLQAHGIGASEVDLGQSDHLLATLNLLPSGNLPGPAAVLGVLLVLVALWFVGVAWRFDPSPATRPRMRTAGWPARIGDTIRSRMPCRTSGLVLVYVALAFLAIAWGYRSGQAQADAQMQPGRGISAALVALDAGGARPFDDMPLEGYLTSSGQSRLLFSDGATLFLFVPNTEPHGARGTALRVPVHVGRGLVTVVRPSSLRSAR
jgi:hypothetical protein